jgi:hypothetical protein
MEYSEDLNLELARSSSAVSYSRFSISVLLAGMEDSRRRSICLFVSQDDEYGTADWRFPKNW